MHVGRIVVVAMTAALLLIGAAPSHGAAKFRNCTAMNKLYRHCVGRMGARDKTSGTPVMNFKVSNRVYAANRGSDRDKDGIACEKR
jgi:hypothetical protein